MFKSCFKLSENEWQTFYLPLEQSVRKRKTKQEESFQNQNPGVSRKTSSVPYVPSIPVPSAMIT